MQEEESWWVIHGGGIMRKDHEDGINKGGIMEEES